MQNFYRIKSFTYLIKRFISGILPLTLTILLMLNAGIPAFAADGQTINNTRISIMADDLSLKDVFSIIEKKTTFIIGYDNTVDVKKHITLHASNKTVSEVLRETLMDYKGTISQVDEHHVLIRVEKAPVVNPPAKIQQSLIRIVGTVVDEKNIALPGVSVSEKVSHKGTGTDVNGQYVISVETGATLVFSFIGYENQEVVVSNQTTINIKLKPATNILNEVVAIGYQTVRKSDFTGAISSVKASELNLSAPTVGQALVGKVAGVQVSQVSGAPYESTKIRVRGVGSINASSDPLYVIDGYPAGNDLFINPEDIESIDILKDAASAAIYGSRAAGGVVLITTKHGAKDDKGKLEYDFQIGINQLAKKVDLLNSDQFAQLVIDGRNDTYHDLMINTGHAWTDAMYSDPNATRIANVGNASSVSIPLGLYNFGSQTLIHQTINTDWQNELYRNAITESHNLSFTGSSANTKYYLSAGYQDQPGIMLGTGQQKINLRANIDGNIGKRLKITGNISFTQNTNQETQDGRWDHSPTMGALIYMPIFPAYNADGKYSNQSCSCAICRLRLPVN